MSTAHCRLHTAHCICKVVSQNYVLQAAQCTVHYTLMSLKPLHTGKVKSETGMAKAQIMTRLHHTVLNSVD